MTDSVRNRAMIQRDEIIYTLDDIPAPVRQRPRSSWQRISDIPAFRKSLLLALLAGIWEAYARYLGNELVLPTFSGTMLALFSAIASGELPRAATRPEARAIPASSSTASAVASPRM